MKAYLDIVNKVLTEGVMKGNRTGIDTLAVPFVHFEHDMSKGFPLLTTKKMPIKSVAVELEGFLKGITSKKWYQERGCNIWNEWCNPKKIPEYVVDYEKIMRHPETHWMIPPMRPISDYERIQYQRQEDDLGPIYGFQWRRFNEVYSEHDNGALKGVDQLRKIVDTLHKNPLDRRMVCLAWNPQQIDQMALPSCHTMWNVVVIGDTINLGWYQRSCDLMLGVPFNIASYALLLELLAKESGLIPGKLSGTLADCHIYENHIEGAKEQLSREPRELPTIEIPTNQSRLGGYSADPDYFDIFKWDHTQFTLLNYNPHPRISFGGVAI